jgi:hypothetical protein
MLLLGIRHVLTTCAIGLLPCLMTPTTWAASPGDALAKCDALASDPHDPGRYAAGVTDEQFAPGATIDACKAAVDANPDLARSWFQLGRAYWVGEHDTDAFSAFVQAAKRGYAPAMKYIGDAYSQGRGLPPGEEQSPDIALSWYKKAKGAGLREADKAIQDLSTAIASNTFNPSLFQNPSYMKRLYDGNFDAIDNPVMFFAYTKAFADEIGGTNVFFINQSCKGMVTALGGVINGFGQLLGYLQALQGENALANIFVSAIGSSFTQDQGERDAVILMDNYKCNSPITRRIIDNVVGSYQKLPTIVKATFANGREDMERKRVEAATQGIAFSGSTFFSSGEEGHT